MQHLAKAHVVPERLHVGGQLRLVHFSHDDAELSEGTDVLHVDGNVVLDEHSELADVAFEGRQLVPQSHQLGGEWRLGALRQAEHLFVVFCNKGHR